MGESVGSARGAAPVYLHVPAKVTEPFLRRLLSGATLDNLFFFASCVNVLLLAFVLFRQGLGWSWQLLYLIGFWLVLTYLALPRLHRMLTALYVPDYFIGRTHTSDGLLGDPVNLAVRGSAEQIHGAMRRAGWTLADPITARSAWRIVVSSLRRRSYPNAPVSPLVLFGRVQSFAYQQEVAGNPAQRHHVRFWPTPPGWLLPGGHRVDWLAAGTYDRSVGLSLFTWQVTHKIDANIDSERDYIVETVRFASPNVRVSVLENFSTGYHSRNGGGDAVVTDGDLPVLELSILPGLVTIEPEPETDTDSETDSDSETDTEPASKTVESLVGRPPAIAAGVVLLVAAACCDIASYTPALYRELGHASVGVDPATRLGILAAVFGSLSLLYVVLGVLLWRVFVGRGWARILLLALVTVQVLGQLFTWLRAPAGTLSWLALFTTGLYVLAVYAFSSLTARNFTASARARRRLSRVTSRSVAAP